MIARVPNRFSLMLLYCIMHPRRLVAFQAIILPTSGVVGLSLYYTVFGSRVQVN